MNEERVNQTTEYSKMYARLINEKFESCNKGHYLSLIALFFGFLAFLVFVTAFFSNRPCDTVKSDDTAVSQYKMVFAETRGDSIFIGYKKVGYMNEYHTIEIPIQKRK